MLLPNRLEAVPSAKPASDETLRLCATERDAMLTSIQLSGLTYEEVGARIGVSKQAVHKWIEAGVPSRRVRAFCNATGTNLIQQFYDLQAAIRAVQGRQRESDRIAHIASYSKVA